MIGRKREKESTEEKSSNSAPNVDRQYKKLQRSSRFWNKVDPANRFRHWYFGIKGFTRSIFRVVAAWQTIVILISVLVILYIMAAFYTGKGEFVIKLDRPMADEGFIISENKDFSDKLVTLRDDAVDNATNISIYDIDKNVMNVDGKHNGANYLAYTFYLKNKTRKAHDYHYELTMASISKHVDKAAWVMVYKNGKQIIYAKKNKGGYAECQYSKWEFPFVKDAEDKEYQQSLVDDPGKAHITQEMIDYGEFTELKGLYQLQTKPFEGDSLVCTGSRQNIEVDEVDKYTVVVWLEGNDPDCKNDILGGHIEMTMKFTY